MRAGKIRRLSSVAKKRLQMCPASRWFVFTHAAVAIALPQIATCPPNRRPTSRCYSSTASSAPRRQYFSPDKLFFAVLPMEISVVPSWVALSECSDCLHIAFFIFNEIDSVWHKWNSALMYIHLRWSLESTIWDFPGLNPDGQFSWSVCKL